MRKFKPEIVEVDVADSAQYFCELFTAKASTTYENPEDKIYDLMLVLDDLEGLSEKYDQGFDARKAVRNGLKTCWENLPQEPNVKMAVRPRLMISAAQFGVALTRV